jgi:ethanolamine utilization protein EutN
MQIGKIVGCVVSTVKNPGLAAQKLLIVQPLTPELKFTGKQLVCTDSTGAGAGELVYWCKGKEASFPFLPTQVPTDSTVVGIIDKITVRRGHRNE